LLEEALRKRGTFGKFVLEKFSIRLKMEPFFETAEVCSANNAVKCLGTR
jgi:hypothetical protein